MNFENFVYYVGIGLGLAMDAFAVTVGNCATFKGKLSKVKSWAMPVAFSLFQIIMPVIGFYLGSVFAEYLSEFAGFITAGVFLLLAVKIVVDKIKDLRKPEIISKSPPEKQKEFGFILLVIQAVATSIDALLVGFSFSCEGVPSPFVPSLIIGAVTFITVSLALFIGKTLGKKLGNYAEWAGAGILFILFSVKLIGAIV